MLLGWEVAVTDNYCQSWPSVKSSRKQVGFYEDFLQSFVFLMVRLICCVKTVLLKSVSWSLRLIT